MPATSDDLSSTPVFQEGIKPAMFKALLGKGHEEFSTMRQQDAEEYFAHLLKVLRQQAKKVGDGADAQPTDVFRFGMEQRLQCMSCNGVRYRVDEQDDLSVPVPARELGKTEEGKVLFASVPLTECLEIVTGLEDLEYTCPRCGQGVIARK